MKVTLPMTTAGLPEPPPYPEAPGEPWPFLLVHGDEAVFADSNTDLVGALIDGYDELPDDPGGDDEALLARYAQALVVAAATQTEALLAATDHGDFVAGDESEEVLTALFCDRSIPFNGLVGPDGEVSYRWDHVVPLVLIDTDYAPFSARPRPEGNVVWVCPSTETAYLKSLHLLQLVVYAVADGS